MTDKKQCNLFMSPATIQALEEMAKAEKMQPPPPQAAPPEAEAPAPQPEAPAPPSEAVNGLVLALQSAAQSFATAGMKGIAALVGHAAEAAKAGDAETMETALHGALSQVGDIQNAPPEIQRAVQVLAQVAQALAKPPA